jgi:hypothetical protein
MAGPEGRVVGVTESGEVARPRPDWNVAPWLILFDFKKEEHKLKAEHNLELLRPFFKGQQGDLDSFSARLVSGEETERIPSLEVLYKVQIEHELMFAVEALSGLLPPDQAYHITPARIKELRLLHPDRFRGLVGNYPKASKPPRMAGPGATAAQIQGRGPNWERNRAWKAANKARRRKPASPAGAAPTAAPAAAAGH